MYFLKNKNNNNISSTEEWNDLSNWWDSELFDKNLEFIPNNGSDISIFSNVENVYIDTSFNVVKIYSDIFNASLICNECFFYGNSKFYEGNCINANKVTFAENSVNAGYIASDTYFRDNSSAQPSSVIGDILINKNVYVFSPAQKPLLGTVVGNNIYYID